MAVKLDENAQEISQSYMARWFVEKDPLARLCGTGEQQLDEFIEAGCAPGIIYSFHPENGWWSALAACLGTAPELAPKGGSDWYAPGAAWWIRRAMLGLREGSSLAQATSGNERHFVTQFQELIGTIPHAAYSYGSCFAEDGTVSHDETEKAAISEWGSWISGAFAVCLPYFSAENCIRKEALAARIKCALEAGAGQDEELSPVELFGLVETLASLIAPFSPWERPTCTPGVTIDRVLAQFDLGAALPFDAPGT